MILDAQKHRTYPDQTYLWYRIDLFLLDFGVHWKIADKQSDTAVHYETMRTIWFAPDEVDMMHKNQ